ncbi:MAG: ATP synthase F1 subunit delta [Pseudomonadota bacterium]
MRLEQVRLARPYANALVGIAKTTEGLESWLKHLEYLAEILKAPESIAILKNPTLLLSDKKALLKSAWSQFDKNLPEEADRFIELLMDNRRIFILPELIEALKSLRDQKQGCYKAVVEGAYPLNAQDEETIKAWLESEIGKKVYIEFQHNPELIGGIKAQVGDETVYASTEHLLRRLQESLKRD